MEVALAALLKTIISGNIFFLLEGRWKNGFIVFVRLQNSENRLLKFLGMKFHLNLSDSLFTWIRHSESPSEYLHSKPKSEFLIYFIIGGTYYSIKTFVHVESMFIRNLSGTFILVILSISIFTIASGEKKLWLFVYFEWDSAAKIRGVISKISKVKTGKRLTMFRWNFLREHRHPVCEVRARRRETKLLCVEYKCIQCSHFWRAACNKFRGAKRARPAPIFLVVNMCSTCFQVMVERIKITDLCSLVKCTAALTLHFYRT